MAKMNAKAPKPAVPGKNGASNSDDKMASKSAMTYAIRTNGGTPAQYAADEVTMSLMGDNR
jgi:hypothetical protein